MKFIEIRDEGTFIPALAFELPDHRLARRAGFRADQFRSIVLIKLVDFKSQYDPFQWDNSRTMTAAHHWIEDHWDEVVDGQVVDVQFILGETEKPKVPE